MKIFLKSVMIWQNYGDESVSPFFGPLCIFTLEFANGSSAQLMHCEQTFRH